ncbi:MAG: phage portal protein [Turicibacter sp.]|nr:phage portal protein [Turicibacter sp.]MDO4925374.1 phage portal protein [Turicibacter sp.]
MGLFKKLTNRGDVKLNINSDMENILTKNGDIIPTENNIYNIPAVKFGIELISGLVGSIPIYLYKEDTATGDIKRVNDYRIRLLNNEPNILITGVDLKRLMIKDLILYGNAYSMISRDLNTIKSINYVHPESINFRKKFDNNGSIVDIDVMVQMDRVQYNPNIMDTIICTIDSRDHLKGIGLLEKNKELLSLGLKEIDSYKNYLNEGNKMRGVLAFEQPFKLDVWKKLKEQIQDSHAGRRGTNLLLTNGSKPTFIKTSLEPKESQLMESRQLSNEQVLQMLGLNDIKDMNQIYKTVLMPFMEILESAFDKYLLLEIEKEEGYFFQFDTTEFLRSSYKDVADNVNKLFKAGIYSLNESRRILNLEPKEEDYHLHSLGNVYKYDDGDVYVPNMDGGNAINNLIK